MFTPETPDGEVSFVGIQQNIEPDGNNKYKMSFAGVEMQNATALTVRKDLTLWILGIEGLYLWLVSFKECIGIIAVFGYNALMMNGGLQDIRIKLVRFKERY